MIFFSKNKKDSISAAPYQIKISDKKPGKVFAVCQKDRGFWYVSEFVCVHLSPFLIKRINASTYTLIIAVICFDLHSPPKNICDEIKIITSGIELISNHFARLIALCLRLLFFQLRRLYENTLFQAFCFFASSVRQYYRLIKARA